MRFKPPFHHPLLDASTWAYFEILSSLSSIDVSAVPKSSSKALHEMHKMCFRKHSCTTTKLNLINQT